MRYLELLTESVNNDELQAFAKMVRQNVEGVESFHLHLNRGIIYLGMIEVDKSSRKQGIGTKIMNMLCDFADLNNAKIVLTTGLRDPAFGTTSQSRLIKFYKRFGFIENKGRNKDFTITGNMYRNPR